MHTEDCVAGLSDLRAAVSAAFNTLKTAAGPAECRGSAGGWDA